jgi:cytochrome oxidase Cu insertion factor (SCO1/SenC/PrrC family)
MVESSIEAPCTQDKTLIEANMAEQTNYENTATKKRKSVIGRAELIGIAAVFLIPAGLAWMTFSNSGWMPTGRSNIGSIIHPPRSIPDSMALEGIEDGQTIAGASLRGKWTLVSVVKSACDAVCRDRLFIMRQARIAVGDDMVRVQRLFILTDSDALPQFQELLNNYRGTLAATGPQKAIEQFLSILDPSGSDTNNHLYIIDPLGNLMMHYPPSEKGVGLVTDLEKLLKISQIG